MVRELTRVTFTCKDCTTPQPEDSMSIPNAESTRLMTDSINEDTPADVPVPDQSTFNLTNPVSFEDPEELHEK